MVREWGKVYKLINNTTGEFYIGSTFRSLESRMYNHNSYAKRFPDRKLYQSMNNNLGKFSMQLMKCYPDFIGNAKLREHEQFYIDLLKPTLNVNSAIHVAENGKEYRKRYWTNNKQKILESNKQYVLKNKEKITEYKKQYYQKRKLLATT